MKTYINIWLTLTAVLTYEYLCLNFDPTKSISRHLGYTISPDPGRAMSLYLGWAGIILMLIMNLYILRKRSQTFAKLGGSLSAWLNFHIFCGLVGPTFIIFHSNFKVRGVVAISFWSMIIAASSGFVGRYFYTQVLRKKKEMADELEKWGQELKSLQTSTNPPVADDRMEKLKARALTWVGVSPGAISPAGTLQVGALNVFISSFLGDLRLLMDLPVTIREFPKVSRVILKNYAVSQRRLLFLEPFRNLMGYWHTFHTPFAIFMYVAAVIHIATALLMGVSK